MAARSVNSDCFRATTVCVTCSTQAPLSGIFTRKQTSCGSGPAEVRQPPTESWRAGRGAVSNEGFYKKRESGGFGVSEWGVSNVKVWWRWRTSAVGSGYRTSDNWVESNRLVHSCTAVVYRAPDTLLRRTCSLQLLQTLSFCAGELQSFYWSGSSTVMDLWQGSSFGLLVKGIS